MVTEKVKTRNTEKAITHVLVQYKKAVWCDSRCNGSITVHFTGWTVQ